MKIGDKIIKDSFGEKIEYEVTGFDGNGLAVVKFIGVVKSDLIDDEAIKEIKTAIEATAPKSASKPTHAPVKKPAPKKVVRK